MQIKQTYISVIYQSHIKTHTKEATTHNILQKGNVVDVSEHNATLDIGQKKTQRFSTTPLATQQKLFNFSLLIFKKNIRKGSSFVSQCEFFCIGLKEVLFTFMNKIRKIRRQSQIGLMIMIL